MATRFISRATLPGSTAGLRLGDVVYTRDTRLFYVVRRNAGDTGVELVISGTGLDASTLTTLGDLLVRGASAPERLGIGGAGQRLLVSLGTASWGDPTKNSSSLPVASVDYWGVAHYHTTSTVASLCLQTGSGTYAWHTLATALYSAAADRPTAGAGYTTCVHWATDTSAPSLCVRTGASTYAWVSLAGVALSSTAPVALGSANAGAGATAARTDHVHPTTGLAVLAAENTYTQRQIFGAGALVDAGQVLTFQTGSNSVAINQGAHTFASAREVYFPDASGEIEVTGAAQTATARKTFGAGMVPFVGTVAQVAAIGSPTVGLMAYATDGRVGAEGAGLGTGCPVYYGNGAWRRFEDGAAVAA